MKSQKLYKQISSHIIENINSGEYKDNQAVPNERELSELFNVSRITSKRALDELKRDGYIYRIVGSGSYVTPKEQRQNLNGLSYLHRNEQNVIALVMPIEPKETGMIETINGASDVLNKSGYFLTVQNSYLNVKKEKEIIKSLVDRNIKGIILYPVDSISNMDLAIKLLIKNFPIVTIDRYYENVPNRSVYSDNQEGAYQITKHLIDNGHKKIAYISSTGIETCSSVRNRFTGYCKALNDFGIEIDDDIIINGDPNVSTELPRDIYFGYVEKLLKNLKEKGVTALEMLNDGEAMMMEKTCLKYGYKVPEDFSITGFDNLELIKHIEKPITTIDQDFCKMGKIAAEMIIEMIDQKIEMQQSVVIPVKLIKRASSDTVIL